jgi:hypothetical protein
VGVPTGKMWLPTPVLHLIRTKISPDFGPGASNGWRCSKPQDTTYAGPAPRTNAEMLAFALSISINTVVQPPALEE